MNIPREHCRFCGLEHAIETRPHRSPCPKVRAFKFDSDGTISHFKLYGVKGWQHKSKMHPFSSTFVMGHLPMTTVNNTVTATDFARISAAALEAGE